MARRVRANKSLIKQRYQGAKVAFPDDADLARSLGVHRSAVVRWKRGEAPAPAGKTRHDVVSLQDYFELFKNEPLQFEPGSQQQYCNAGYCGLGLLYARLSGADYFGDSARV